MRPFSFRTRRSLCVAVALLACVACGPATSNMDARERAIELNARKADAQRLLDESDFEGAVKVLEPLAAEASGDYQLFVMLGDAYRALGEFDNAVRNYESAMRVAYTRFEPHLKLATLLMDNGRTGRALTEFELALKYGERTPMTFYNYGTALYRMGRRDQALEQWRTAQEMDPDNPDFAAAVGVGLTGVDDKNAVVYFEKARALGADDAGFHNNFGLALRSVGRITDSEREFRAAMDRDVDNEEYAFNLASLLTAAGRYGDAVDRWRALIAANGPRWSYSVYCARALVASGDAQGALDMLLESAQRYDTKGLAVDGDMIDRVPPDLADAFETLALAARALGKNDEALALIERSVAHDGKRPTILINYGVILAENGMLADAREQWQKVLRIDPGNKTAMENLSASER